jgi:hypothetical protein
MRGRAQKAREGERERRGEGSWVEGRRGEGVGERGAHAQTSSHGKTLFTHTRALHK